MSIHIHETDIINPPADIHLPESATSCRVLVKQKNIPINWIEYYPDKNNLIPTSQQHTALRKSINLDQMNLYTAGRIGLKNSQNKDDQFSLPSISVVICTRNRSTLLERCLKSVAELIYPSFEVIVVDNAPEDNTTLEIARLNAVRYVREDRPGLDWARNRGIRESQYDIVAFTDDDACVDQHWLTCIARSFLDPEVSCVTGYVAPAELKTGAQQIFELGYGGMGHGFRKKTIRRHQISERQLVWASGFGVGANMAFRKTVFQFTGYFDVALDVGTPSCGGGDVEMFHRLVAMGKVLVYDPAVLVWHYHRTDMISLKKQIINNGRSFGCYLLACINNRTVSTLSVIRFLLSDWLLHWIFRNLKNPPKHFPRKLAIWEFYGMMTSVWAYYKTKKQAKRIADNGFETKIHPVSQNMQIQDPVALSTNRQV